MGLHLLAGHRFEVCHLRRKCAGSSWDKAVLLGCMSLIMALMPLHAASPQSGHTTATRTAERGYPRCGARMGDEQAAYFFSPGNHLASPHLASVAQRANYIRPLVGIYHSDICS